MWREMKRAVDAFHALPPLQSSCTFIFMCHVCVMFYTYTHIFVGFLLFPVLDRHLFYGVYWCNHTPTHIRPTQSIMYVPLQVNRSQKCILLFVQYKYIKSCYGDFNSPESDPTHKIMRYWVYYSTQLVFGFPTDRICQVEKICISGVPVLKRHFGGAGP